MKRLLPLMLALALTPALADDSAAVAARIAEVRAMPAAANAAAAGAQRHALDQAWRYFGDHRDDALPALRRELAAELRSARPNPLLLLDAGYFLRVYGAASDRALATQALLAIPPEAAVDGAQLFRFAHAVAGDGEPRLLPLLDRAFLHGHVSVPVPQHGTVIEDAGVCAFLYGRLGEAGERHLAGLLHDPSSAQRALDVLLMVGSPDSVPAVGALLASPDMELFSRAVTFMLRNGGPQGRDALLALKPEALPEKAREFFAPLREQIAKAPQPPAPQGQTPDAEVRRQLDVLEAGYGSFDGVDAATIMQSHLPRQELAERLQRIRQRAYERVTTAALADIETLGAMLNALRYRHD